MALRQSIQKTEPPIDLAQVQARKRVVHQHHFGFERQRASQANSLLPVAAKRARCAVSPRRQLQRLQNRAHLRLRFGPAEVAMIAQRQGDIF